MLYIIITTFMSICFAFGCVFFVGDALIPSIPVSEDTNKNGADEDDNPFRFGYWTNFHADKFAGGKGTASLPYQISTPEQLALLSYLMRESPDSIPENGDLSVKFAHYSLIADLDMRDHYWIPIGHANEFTSISDLGKCPNVFYGSFDGGGHTISNLRCEINRAEWNRSDYFVDAKIADVGLFGAVLAAGREQRIHNFQLYNSSVYVYGDSNYGNTGTLMAAMALNIGAVVGISPSCIAKAASAVKTVRLENIKVDGFNIYLTKSEREITEHYLRAGGIIGFTKGKQTEISNCMVFGDSEFSYVFNGEETSIYNMASIGGIVGEVDTYVNTSTYVSNCYNSMNFIIMNNTSGDVKFFKLGIGGIVGAVISGTDSGFNDIVKENSTKLIINSCANGGRIDLSCAPLSGTFSFFSNITVANSSVYASGLGGIIGTSVHGEAFFQTKYRTIEVNECVNYGTIGCESCYTYMYVSNDTYRRRFSPISIGGIVGAGGRFMGQSLNNFLGGKNELQVSLCLNFGRVGLWTLVPVMYGQYHYIYVDELYFAGVGGIIGSCGVAKECVNYGKVFACNVLDKNAWGGIVGAGEVDHCLNYGDVKTVDNYVEFLKGNYTYQKNHEFMGYYIDAENTPCNNCIFAEDMVEGRYDSKAVMSIWHNSGGDSLYRTLDENDMDVIRQLNSSSISGFYVSDIGLYKYKTVVINAGDEDEEYFDYYAYVVPDGCINLLNLSASVDGEDYAAFNTSLVGYHSVGLVSNELVMESWPVTIDTSDKKTFMFLLGADYLFSNQAMAYKCIADFSGGLFDYGDDYLTLKDVSCDAGLTVSMTSNRDTANKLNDYVISSIRGMTYNRTANMKINFERKKIQLTSASFYMVDNYKLDSNPSQSSLTEITDISNVAKHIEINGTGITGKTLYTEFLPYEYQLIVSPVTGYALVGVDICYSGGVSVQTNAGYYGSGVFTLIDNRNCDNIPMHIDNATAHGVTPDSYRAQVGICGGKASELNGVYLGDVTREYENPSAVNLDVKKVFPVGNGHVSHLKFFFRKLDIAINFEVEGENGNVTNTFFMDKNGARTTFDYTYEAADCENPVVYSNIFLYKALGLTDKGFGYNWVVYDEEDTALSFFESVADGYKQQELAGISYSNFNFNIMRLINGENGIFMDDGSIHPGIGNTFEQVNLSVVAEPITFTASFYAYTNTAQNLSYYGEASENFAVNDFPINDDSDDSFAELVKGEGNPQAEGGYFLKEVFFSGEISNNLLKEISMNGQDGSLTTITNPTNSDVLAYYYSKLSVYQIGNGFGRPTSTSKTLDFDARFSVGNLKIVGTVEGEGLSDADKQNVKINFLGTDGVGMVANFEGETTSLCRSDVDLSFSAIDNAIFLGWFLKSGNGDGILAEYDDYDFYYSPAIVGSYDPDDKDTWPTLKIIAKFFKADSGTQPQYSHGTYRVSTAQHLLWLSSAVARGQNFENVVFKQTADINMSGVRFAPIGSYAKPFKGVYDGGNFSISNLNIDVDISAVGLFGCTEGATIKNLILEGGQVRGQRAVGAFVGEAANTTFSMLYNLGCKVETTEWVPIVDIYGQFNEQDREKYGFGGIAGYVNSGYGNNSFVGCFSSATVLENSSEVTFAPPDWENEGIERPDEEPPQTVVGGGLIGVVSAGGALIDQCYVNIKKTDGSVQDCEMWGEIWFNKEASLSNSYCNGTYYGASLEESSSSPENLSDFSTYWVLIGSAGNKSVYGLKIFYW